MSPFVFDGVIGLYNTNELNFFGLKSRPVKLIP